MRCGVQLGRVDFMKWEIEVPVVTPALWWRGAAKNLRGWVTRDPDVADNVAPRWSGCNRKRWNLIAAAVAAVGDELARKNWSFESGNEGYYGSVNVVLPEELTSKESEVLISWFSVGSSIRVDPWSSSLIDGRHRLWSTLDHFGESLVPVGSEALMLVYPGSDAGERVKFSKGFRDHVCELAKIDWFDRCDPLNIRFFEALRRASKGENLSVR